MSTNECAARVAAAAVVIGLGNPLMGDDGLGLAALERLRDRWVLPPEVELVDGGTWGLALLPVIEQARHLVFLDAIATGAAPGTPVVVPRARLPRYLATKVSPHQVDLGDVVALAELRGTLPAETVAVGLEPQRVEFGVGLSALIAERLDALVDAVVRQLAAWGYACTPREAAGDA
jgi:hydrogenase maturation protease